MSVVFDWQQVNVHLGGRRQVHALKEVTLRIVPGERVAVIGPNGSGKSTLLRALHGLLPMSSGQAWSAPRRGGDAFTQAMLFQRPFLLRVSALNNVRLALWLAGQRGEVARQRADEALQRVGLSDVARRNGRALSGGQQQRLALARAWALQPDVWLLDEPTASLDPHAKRDVETLMEAFASELGATMVFSSHNLGQVKRLAHRVVYLEGGELLADLPVNGFFNESVLEAVCPRALAFIKGDV